MIDIIGLTTLLVKFENGQEYIVHYDYMNHKIYPTGVLPENEEEKIILCMKAETEQDVEVPEQEIVEKSEIEDIVAGLIKQVQEENYDS